MDLNTFCTKYNGQKVDSDGAFGAQCVDLFRQYLKDVWDLPHTGTVDGAKDLYLNYDKLPLEKKYLRKVVLPICGDIVVFGATPSNKYGHVAIFLAQQDDNMLVFEQNGFTQDGAKYVWRSAQGFIGALRRR